MLSACAPSSFAEDAFPNQPGALSPDELQAATAVLAADLPAEAPKLKLLASGKRDAGHSMPAYVVFESSEVPSGSPPKRAICNFLIATNKWHCSDLPPQARVVLEVPKQTGPAAPLPEGPAPPRRTMLDGLSGLSEPSAYLSMFIALLALIVPFVLSSTRGLKAAASASVFLTAASWVLGLASFFVFPPKGPFGGMVLFFVVPPALLALLACGVWWVLLLVAKLREKRQD